MSMTPLQAAEFVGTLSHVTNPITTMDEAIQMCGRYVRLVEYLRNGHDYPCYIEMFSGVGVAAGQDDGIDRASEYYGQGKTNLDNLKAACDAKAERTGTTAPD